MLFKTALDAFVSGYAWMVANGLMSAQAGLLGITCSQVGTHLQ